MVWIGAGASARNWTRLGATVIVPRHLAAELMKLCVAKGMRSAVRGREAVRFNMALNAARDYRGLVALSEFCRLHGLSLQLNPKNWMVWAPRLDAGQREQPCARA
jgi:hypothetical protein